MEIVVKVSVYAGQLIGQLVLGRQDRKGKVNKMKKTIAILTAILLVATAIFFTGCANRGGTRMNDSTETIWVEGNGRPVLDECGTRSISIQYREVDLSEPDFPGGAWYESGSETTLLQSDLAQVLGRPITTRDEAADIANKILETESEQRGVDIEDIWFELMQIEHDPDQNIWIFGYWENGPDPGSSFHVAIDGVTGELLRMWVM